MIRYVLATILIFLSLVAYFSSHSDTLLWSTISTISFWTSILLLLPKSFYSFLHRRIVAFKTHKTLWAVIGAYMTYHVILYSFFFYLLLPGSIKALSFQFTFNAGIGYSIPPSLPYFLQWVSTSPAIWFFIGPYEGDIIPFSTIIGIFLAILIGLNVIEIKELWGLSRYKASKAVVLVPSIGVISGSSCCVFLPSIIMYSIALSITALTSTILSILSNYVYFVLAYYMLPVISAIILFHNLVVTDKLLGKIARKGITGRRE
ncbi:hypothetical protein BFU36_08435 [Sulfolobus sp. A20]|uniref:hypothetical protein n=1 Tax=Sulfolobaceae TaxID=118883 RepID=UPI000845F55D|nr:MULTISPECIES: hypothetical protein [unclassified Sulfolobus]TRM77879.1 hypothetical protein DJ532_03040 [Sulfolobus sp. A20-N-F8]TRM80871.1 hypothetical protein DJ524_06060 [Sulfolobus sp. D5]TRM83901.1 hypothetical protein DJ522_05615 [Sulfolobus sp. F3]TRN02182.1 hypothetical protein DJ530_04620 [Sulfolobus sp. E1]AOL16726.1 hypothetical protein BFU36_08435 [Sulfolobus sp. A20]